MDQALPIQILRKLFMVRAPLPILAMGQALPVLAMDQALPIRILRKLFDPPMGPPIYCPFCVMYLNGPTQWENHKIGKKHRKAIAPYPGLFKLVHLAWAEFKAKTDGLKLKKVLYLRYYPLPLRPFATPR